MSKYNTGDRVRVVTQEGKGVDVTCEGAIGRLVDDDTDTPLVVFYKTEYLKPSYAIRTQRVTEGREWYVGDNKLELIQESPIYSRGDIVRLLEEVTHNGYTALVDTIGTVIDVGDLDLMDWHDGIPVTVKIDDIVFTIPNYNLAPLSENLDLSVEYKNPYDIMHGDLVNYKGEEYVVCDLEDEGTCSLRDINGSRCYSIIDLSDLELVKACEAYSEGDKVRCILDNTYSRKGDIGEVKETSYNDGQDYRVQWEDKPSAWMTSPCLERIPPENIVGSTPLKAQEIESVERSGDGTFEREVTFFY